MGVKGRLIKKGIAKIKKKISSINSTDNMSTSGPIDNAINKGMYNPSYRTHHGTSGAKGDMIPDNLLDRPTAGSRGTLGPKDKYVENPITNTNLKYVTKKDGRRVIEDKSKNIY